MATVKLKIIDFEASFDHDEYGKMSRDQQEYALECLYKEVFEIEVENPDDDDEVHEALKDHLSREIQYDVYHFSYEYLS